MAKRRGFFAELQRQSAQAERQRRQAEVHAARMRAQNLRLQQQAAREAERQARQNARAHESLVRQLAAEEKRRHQQEQQDETAARNRELAERTNSIEGLFSTRIEHLAPVDRSRFHVEPAHPPFASKHDRIVAPPPAPQLPPEPRFTPPPPPQGMSARFGGAKKHAEEVARLQALHNTIHANWDSSGRHC